MLAGGVLALYTAVRLRRGTHEQARRRTADGLPLTGKMIAGACVVTVVSGIAASGAHESDPLGFVVTWLAFAIFGLAVWAVEHRIRNRRRRVSATPRAGR
jgi:undecaprenyl pyrophosphate phosphatase UppP